MNWIKKKQAKTLLSRGEPYSQEEYLFLFPDACHDCGCRKHIRTAEYEHLNPGIGVDYKLHCTRCKTMLNSWNVSTSDRTDLADVDEIIIEIESPYLKHEEAATFQDHWVA
jgi:hypothetical protein